jgi:hypothetical protein
MSWMGFEPTILALKRAKTVHSLDRAAIVVGLTTSSIKDIEHIYDASSRKAVPRSCAE